MSKIIQLSKIESTVAAYIGISRRIESIFSKRSDGQFSKSDPWEIDIEGASAEMAVSKAIGKYWPCGLNTFHDSDVGKCIQVRSTRIPSGHLIIRGDDNPDHYYFLVIHGMPKYNVCGWIKGSDGMTSKYKRNPNGNGDCWMVPQVDLVKLK